MEWWLMPYLGSTHSWVEQAFTGANSIVTQAAISAEINSPGDSIITELEWAEIWWQNILPSEPCE
jgi:hypothetical protein